jgi:hypothetical protein
MKHSDLELLLTVFRQSREQIVLDFNNENIEIYDAMFRYEKDKISMHLSIDKYFMSWIDTHFSVFESLTENNDSPDTLTKEFTKRMLLLIQENELSMRASEIGEGRQLFFKMLHEKKELLHKLSGVGETADSNYKKLLYLYQKDKALFDRQLSELAGNKL